METTQDEKLRYPVGRHEKPAGFTGDKLQEYIRTIESFPALLAEAVSRLSREQLDTPYRPDGWTVRQVVHHCADSHMNAFIRFKLALTEEAPTIKPYYEARWAELPDSQVPVEISLQLLGGLHSRWTVLLKSLQPAQLAKTYIHPEHGSSFRLDEVLSLYAWHCRHHLAHVTSLKDRMGWR